MVEVFAVLPGILRGNGACGERSLAGASWQSSDLEPKSSFRATTSTEELTVLLKCS